MLVRNQNVPIFERFLEILSDIIGAVFHMPSILKKQSATSKSQNMAMQLYVEINFPDPVTITDSSMRRSRSSGGDSV